MYDKSFYKGKRVLITGHTGFKGSWLVQMLLMAGAKVTGYALAPPERESLFKLCGFVQGQKSACETKEIEYRLGKDENSQVGTLNSVIGDIRDLDHLKKVFDEARPEIVIHMAAQPLVRESYRDPVCTYETNVMGTVNVMECLRLTDGVKSFINVTTDKVYLNREWNWGYRENEELNGYDPYSNSKSCSELVTSSYLKSFFTDRDIAVSTCRAGNVIGGGDFAADRIIPDCVRAALSHAKSADSHRDCAGIETGRSAGTETGTDAGTDIETRGDSIIVRNPYSVRPYQHVLEPLAVYLLLAQKQFEDKSVAGSYNVGPDESDCLTTGDLADLFCDTWNRQTGEGVKWVNRYDGGPHEANFLKLDCSKLKSTFNWKPVWNIQTVMEKIVEWSDRYRKKQDVAGCMREQIEAFLTDSEMAV